MFYEFLTCLFRTYIISFLYDCSIENNTQINKIVCSFIILVASIVVAISIYTFAIHLSFIILKYSKQPLS